MMKIDYESRSFSANHALASPWALLVRDATRKDAPFISQEALKELIPNDPNPQSLVLLKLMTKIVRHPRRAPPNPNYYFVKEGKEEVILAGFLMENDRISAPAPHNISYRHASAPFILERWEKTPEGKFKPQKRTIVYIINGKLEISGDLKLVLSVL